MKRIFSLAAMTLASISACCGVAAADMTLGTTTRPSGAVATHCDALGGEESYVQLAPYSTSSSYTVPAGGGQITQWSTNTSADPPSDSGLAVQLEVVRPQGFANPLIVATDQEALPQPLPAGGVATFKLSTPIKVRAGDVIAIASWDGPPTCFWSGGETPGVGSGVFLAIGALDSSPNPPFTDVPTTLRGAAAGLLNVSAVLHQPPASRPAGHRCRVPNLRGTPVGVAKGFLTLLGCRVKVVRHRGHGVPTNAVMATRPRAGTYRLGRTITLLVRK